MKHLLVFLFASFPCIALSQDPTLSSYLDNMNFAPIHVTGKIGFTDDRDREFILRSENGDLFSARIDAGRDARTRIMNECDMGSSIFFEIDEMCDIDASGSVEIDGSRISISIEEIVALSK